MLNQDFKEFIQLLNENQVKYLVIGGYAVAIHDFQSPDQVIQLGYPPNRIDLITTPDGVDFQTCYNSRTEVLLSDIVVNFIDLDNLKKNKLASGRFQDLADLENLQNPQKFWYCDRLIDEIVYQLYGLTPEEKAIIKDKFQ